MGGYKKSERKVDYRRLERVMEAMAENAGKPRNSTNGISFDKMMASLKSL